MVGLDHGPAQSDEPEDAASSAHNARIGRILFVIYLAFYVGYMFLTAFKYDSLRQAFGGMNLAVLYGFGLIVGALVMALLYGVLCRTGKESS